MSIFRPISAELINWVLYEAATGRRFTQDSPVLPEVWLAHANGVACGVNGLIIPRKGHQAHHVANELHHRIGAWRHKHKQEIDGIERTPASVSDMPGLVSANLHFDEIVNVLLPLTRWWQSDGLDKFFAAIDTVELERFFTEMFVQMRNMWTLAQSTSGRDDQLSFDKSGFQGAVAQLSDSTIRVLLLIGLIASARHPGLRMEQPSPIKDMSEVHEVEFAAACVAIFDGEFLKEYRCKFAGHQPDDVKTKQKLQDPMLVFNFNLNRSVQLDTTYSIQATKADAADRVFNVSTRSINWAVIDSGIDATHNAFELSGAGNSRIIAKYDMTLVHRIRNRDLIEWGNTPHTAAIASLATDIMARNMPPDLTQDDVTAIITRAVTDLCDERAMDFDQILPALRVGHQVLPSSDHGTHVAGILGGQMQHQTWEGEQVTLRGMCPDINIIDMCVIDTIGDIAADARATEWAVVSALRLVEHLNRRDDFLSVHGVNMSLSIRHDVTNYACGRTPVCVEAENLVNNGVAVVAAAGNAGYNVFHTEDGARRLHTTTSITDPGNAEAVITVGSTHRIEPHNYGVSYFSSRGPTGDGRMKPDLVAPGEKIIAPIRNNATGVLEGTSMAAPHVSGAAAMLMARFEELKGNPQRIKQVLCDAATDLGRERAFQGHGMLDILRALQSV